MCLDQHGCRYLQRQLDTGDEQVIKVIFDEVIDNIVQLMSDPFGNYLCQKLIEHCSDEQRIEIVKGVAGDIVHISKNMHGTRAVQKLIEHLSSPEENKLIRKALKGSVVGLIQDLNGNHVIQKCLHKMEPNDNQFIYDAVAQHCVQVSTHRHGCCVMQRCIDHATYQQKLQLVKEIKCAAASLVQDAFGNYVVQYALDLDIPNLATELIAELQSKLLYLSRQKFSSNVVEKCLKVGSATCVIRVLRELMDEDPDPDVPNPVPSPNPEIIQQNLIELLQDSYGNYVIQTCLSEGAVKGPKEYQRMVNLLNPYVHQLRNAPYIKRIQNLLSLPTKPNATIETNDNHNNNGVLEHDLGGIRRDPRATRPNNMYFTNTTRFTRQ
uniref:PUM-HD domain-containing protein n=1 Tax=Arcella intermedia TaxID=1963864 RepID=A0A6B2L4Q5_9EUKA